MNDAPAPPEDENYVMAHRRAKLEQWRADGQAYPNDFRRDAMAAEVRAQYGERSIEAFDAEVPEVAMAGRLMGKRIMGKASFVDLHDGSGSIQVFVQPDNVGEEAYAAFKTLDVGDLVGVEGTPFKTRRGELSLRARRLRLLSKSLRPLPEKWAGLTDTEMRYRQRYVDLIVNPAVREAFQRRAQAVAHIRRFLDARGFIEVETPMLQAIPGGAAARPFVTHYNALDRDFYLRIAPELYLKRLVVGGFERVYEINRNFRNEGVSTRHNPEFTMLEFYEAYVDFHHAMDLVESLLRESAETVCGSAALSYQGRPLDLAAPFERIALSEAVARANPGLDRARVHDREHVAAVAQARGIAVAPSSGAGKLLTELFEKTVESQLWSPTFITAYPTEVSPLARRNEDDPEITDRFELFIGGREVANGFSELNDPDDQAARFRQQVEAREDGDDEAMHFDADYIRALEYGLPPTAGVGIGIDRWVMVLTDSPSIRDVLLFPQLRAEMGH